MTVAYSAAYVTVTTESNWAMDTAYQSLLKASSPLYSHHTVEKLTITARYVPELRRNLLSAGALGRQGIHVLCAGARAHIYHAQSNAEIGQARRINEGSEYNLYRIDPTHDTSPLHTALLTCQSNSDTEHDTVSLWHRRLGHSNVRRVRQVFSTA